MFMSVSQYINDPARAETRIHYIIYKVPSDDDRTPRILSFVRANYRNYNLTNDRLYVKMLKSYIGNIVELDDVQIDSAKVVLLFTR